MGKMKEGFFVLEKRDNDGSCCGMLEVEEYVGKRNMDSGLMLDF